MLPLLVTLLTAVAALCLVSIGYLLTILIAAALERRSGGGPSSDPRRVAVVIPAHNEELVLGQTLASLRAQSYPAALLEVVVVADNCTDSTAQIARQSGALVLERHNRELRGKGFALAWAFDQLLAPTSPLEGPGHPPVEAFVILDADTWADPGCVAALTGALPAERGALTALQGRYGVLNTDSSWRAALMSAAFELCNHVKLLGLERLKLSVGLKGNGMIFTRALLERAPWNGRSVTEDIDYGLGLLGEYGVRVGYAPEARVQAQMPVTAAQSESQRARWEGGRYRLMRTRVLPLLAKAARKRDGRLAMAALDLTALPLAEIVGLLALWAILWLIGGRALPAGIRWGFGIAGCAAAAGLLVYVLAGLRLAGAPARVYRSLLRVPFYVAWKLLFYLRQRLTGRKAPAPTSGADAEWVRTERVALPADDDLQRGPAKGTP